MEDRPYVFDASDNAIILREKDGAELLLGTLLAAKFGEQYDPKVMANVSLALLLKEMKACVDAKRKQIFGVDEKSLVGLHFLRPLLETIKPEIIYKEWWRQDHEWRVDYIQNVIAAPLKFAPEEVEYILDYFDDYFERCSEIAEMMARDDN